MTMQWLSLRYVLYIINMHLDFHNFSLKLYRITFGNFKYIVRIREHAIKENPNTNEQSPFYYSYTTH